MYRKYVYALAHKMCFVCFILFWPQLEYTVLAKIDSSLTFMLVNLLVRTLQFTGTLILYKIVDIFTYLGTIHNHRRHIFSTISR